VWNELEEYASSHLSPWVHVQTAFVLLGKEFSMYRPKLLALATLVALGFAARGAAAGTVSYSLSGGGNSATLTFTSVNGGLDIAVANGNTGTIVVSEAISWFNFSINGLSNPTAFTQLTGRSYNPVAGVSWTASSGTAFSAGPGPVIDHWGFTTNGSTLLATAGSPISGGSPAYLILPTAGTAGPGGSLAGNHNPYIIGPAHFFLTVSGLTTSTALTSNNFTNLGVGFGTGPDSYIGTPPPSAVPLPAAAPAGLGMLALLAGVRRLARKRSA
jgi:hypothetical protein